MSSHHGLSRWGEAGRHLKLQCSRCPFTTRRLWVEDGYGACPRCQTPLVRQQPRYAALRAQKAQADLRSQAE